MGIDIQIEIGTEEQQEAIKSELQMVLGWMGDEFLNYIDLHCIIVPLDFDATVNRLQNTTSYSSNRIQLCIGKIIENKGNNHVIISQLAYTEILNFGKRCNFIFHELYHLVNRKNFKIPDYVHTAKSRYLNTIAIMYDEYAANLFAHNLLLKLSGFEIFGDIREDLTNEYKGFLSSIQDEHQYYLPLKQEYQDFRVSGDARKVLNKTIPFIDAAIKDITYCYSFADSHESIKEDFLKRESIFLNGDTENLFNMFREWNASEDIAIDFDKGIDVIKRFVSTCFGIYFSDVPGGERFDLVPF